MNRFVLRGALGAAALLFAGVYLPAGPALAHVTFENPNVAPDATAKLVTRVPHGCEGQATQVLRIQIPEGLLDVKPMPKAGWTLETVSAPYAKPYTLNGREISAGVREIVWSGGSLKDGHYDEFVFRARVTGDLAGKEVPIPVVQECATAKAAWTEIAAPGQDAHGLTSPAPTIRVSARAAAQGNAHGHAHAHGGHQQAPAAAAETRAGTIVVRDAWSPMTLGAAKVAGGYVTIVNEGDQADRLLGGSFEAAGRVEIHEMSDVNGIMRMRQLEQGIAIGPKARADLKPGSFHMMFMDLKRPLKVGEQVRGALQFEKAGTVNVDFVVRPLGTQGAGGHQHH